MPLPPEEDPLNPEEPGGFTPPSVTEPNVPSTGGDSHEGYGGNSNPGTDTPQPPVTPEPDPVPEPPDEPAEPVTPAPDPNGGGGLFEDLWGIAP